MDADDLSAISLTSLFGTPIGLTCRGRGGSTGAVAYSARGSAGASPSARGRVYGCRIIAVLERRIDAFLSAGRRMTGADYACLPGPWIMDVTGSRDLKLWFAGGTNYPGQDDIAARQDRLHEALSQVYARLGGHQRMILEYKLFEPCTVPKPRTGPGLLVCARRSCSFALSACSWCGCSAGWYCRRGARLPRTRRSSSSGTRSRCCVGRSPARGRAAPQRPSAASRDFGRNPLLNQCGRVVNVTA